MSFWRYLLYFAVTAALLSACSSAEDLFNKAVAKDEAAVAAAARAKFPCITVARDTAFIAGDTTVLIECPDMGPENDYEGRVDTIYRDGVRVLVKPQIGKKRVQVAVKVPIRTYYITQRVRDMADSVIAADLGRRLTAATLEASNWKGKAKTRFWIIAGMLAVLAALGYMKWRTRSVSKLRKV